MAIPPNLSNHSVVLVGGVVATHALHYWEGRKMSLSIKVDVRYGNLEQAMRVLKKKVQREGIIKDFRAKSVFEKPSEKKRRKKKEGIANFKKKQKKLKLTRGYQIFTPMLMYIYYCRLLVRPTA